VLMSSDLLGSPQRFNLPGSYGSQTWSKRLEYSLAEFERHPIYGVRISEAQRLIGETERSRANGADLI
jgi:4-alpha-glucanotransferase